MKINLNNITTWIALCIYFVLSLGKIIGMASFILSKPVLVDWQSPYRWYRKDEFALCRARIGHTHLTHSYILNKDPPSQCEHCQCILTVRHSFMECSILLGKKEDIFGKRDFPLFKRVSVWYYILIYITVINIYFLHSSLHCLLTYESLIYKYIHICHLTLYVNTICQTTNSWSLGCCWTFIH